MCASFVLDGGAEFGDAERCEGVWYGGEEGVGVFFSCFHIFNLKEYQCFDAGIRASKTTLF